MVQKTTLAKSDGEHSLVSVPLLSSASGPSLVLLLSSHSSVQLIRQLAQPYGSFVYMSKSEVSVDNWSVQQASG